ncbi:MAG: pyrroline-5-carboxylate reductase [Bacteroidales bacterium]|nr:pyrroline-5-carboxylate reductase [Bacteroidales bacterium]
MKTTIIGAGNMGGATALGLMRAHAAQITVTARHQSTLEKFSGTEIRTTTDNHEAVRDADMVIFAVKPWLMEGVVKDLLPSLNLDRQIVVSMAPGVKPAEMYDWMGGKGELVYVIPNTAIEVGESMTFITPVHACDATIGTVKGIFEKVGAAMVVEEKMMIAGTSLASCGIAYALRYIRAAAEGGVQLGFVADDASRIVAQTVRGAGALLAAHGSHPEAEIDRVTTPGGMTIKGLNAMEEAGFTAAVIKGLKAT